MAKKLNFVGSKKSESVQFTLHVLTAEAFEKKKKSFSFPEKFADELVFENKKTTTKWAAFPEGYGKMTGFFLFREDLSPFTLHEALRKALPMDTLLKGATAVDVTQLKEAEATFFLNAIGNLFALAQYQPGKFGRKGAEKSADEAKKKNHELQIALSAKGSLAEVQKIFQTGYQEGDAANLVRSLADLPGNELRPANYLERIKAFAKELKMTATFLDQKALKKLGAEAFLAVVRANPSEPYGIVKLHYKPKGAKKKVALVGKGLCFDTGGYNIKVGDGMFGMHRDMTGSAVALALTKHLIEEKVNVEIETYLALAENLISPSAYRPNDVVTASNGISIEVVDTDAEGRMVLSDTLVMASREKPDLIIDYATLTGAVIRSIGTARSGAFSNLDRLLKLAHDAGNEIGERVWGFPIGDEYLSGLDSDIADLKQCGPGTYSDHIYAATFLSQFVEGDVPWLHIDLASESNKGGLGLSARDETGFGVRLGKRVIQSFFSMKG